jgi:hypothetical protein
MQTYVMQPKPDSLVALASARFGGLSAAEAGLLAAAQMGGFPFCGPTDDLSDPANDPAKASEWGPERCIRASLIRWLCVEPVARDKVDPLGIRVSGAKVTEYLILSYVTVPFGLTFRNCRFAEDAELISTTLSELDFSASWARSLRADRISVKGGVFLGGGFRAEGEVRLPAAQIGIDLSCENGLFTNPANVAFNADGISVKGNVFLCRGFRAEGEVRFLGARIGGNLDCDGATLRNAPRLESSGSGIALHGDRVKVGGYVFLRNGFSAEGEVKLLNAEIGSNLECDNAKFRNPPVLGASGSGTALYADNIKVAGYVFLRKGFSAQGQVNFLNAKIGSDLECDKATFENPSKEDLPGAGIALCLDGANVRGSVFLGEEFNAEGEVQVSRARIGGHFVCTNAKIDGKFIAQATTVTGGFFWTKIVEPDQCELDVVNTHVNALVDDRQSWPEERKLRIDGLVYERFSSSDTPKSARARLDWLSRQKVFTPQPYRQVARVLRNNGDDAGARRVLSEMERLRRNHECAARNRFLRFRASIWSFVLRATIGYGFHPARSLWWLAGLTILGTALFGAGYVAGSMVPTDKEAYSEFKASSKLPPHYEHFNPFIYSLENSFPLIRFGQADHWQASPDSQWQYLPRPWMPQSLSRLISPWSLRWFRWLQISLGWFFTTMGVAAVTGVVRKE